MKVVGLRVEGLGFRDGVIKVHGLGLKSLGFRVEGSTPGRRRAPSDATFDTLNNKPVPIPCDQIYHECQASNSTTQPDAKSQT